MADRYKYPEGTERFDTITYRKEVYQNSEWVVWVSPHIPKYVDGKLVLPTDTKSSKKSKFNL